MTERPLRNVRPDPDPLHVEPEPVRRDDHGMGVPVMGPILLAALLGAILVITLILVWPRP